MDAKIEIQIKEATLTHTINRKEADLTKFNTQLKTHLQNKNQRLARIAAKSIYRKEQALETFYTYKLYMSSMVDKLDMAEASHDMQDVLDEVTATIMDVNMDTDPVALDKLMGNFNTESLQQELNQNMMFGNMEGAFGDASQNTSDPSTRLGQIMSQAQDEVGLQETEALREVPMSIPQPKTETEPETDSELDALQSRLTNLLS
ncbi:MAG: Snf7 family protein [Promethearchaeota archaeon]